MLTLILNILFSVGCLDTIRMEAADSTPLHMTVYTPECYSPDSVYPVLYLLHGIHGNHFSWEEKAHVRALADSLIAIEQIRPLVIVMPLCVVHDSTYATHIPSYGRCMGDYLRHTKKGEFEHYFPEIEAFVESHYSVRPYAIAGLSAGGRQAAMISQGGRYAVVGLFSPVLTNDQLPKEDIGCYYWIRGGGGDIFYPRARKANRALNRQQVPHDFRRTRGRHNWNTWQRYIEDFLSFAFPTSGTEITRRSHQW